MASSVGTEEDHAHVSRKRALPLWAAIALSLALIGPTLAMSGNGQFLAGSVGKGVPLVFVIGLVAVALVGYGFVRLTRHMNHAGSAYGLVGGVMGPRAGFFAGWAMLGAYVGFAIGTLALTAAFLNSLLASLQPNSQNPFQISWYITVLVGIVISAFAAGRDVHSVAKVLIAIEGVGIVAMIVLAFVILGKGGAPATGIDFSVFTFGEGVTPSLVLAGVVSAFLSWAGFEACASLGEETADPKRNIPRALTGALILTGVLFVLMMFVQTIGFGTDAEGLATFAASSNSLGDLGHAYIGSWFADIIIFTALISAFGCHLATTATSGRMLFAFARNGLGPKALQRTSDHDSPVTAMWFVLAVCLVANGIAYFTGWPSGETPTHGAPIDAYVLFAVAGSATLMVTYFMVEIAATWFVNHPRFGDVHGGQGKVLGTALPILGAVVIVVVLWFNVKDADSWDYPPLLGLYWVFIGLIVTFVANVSRRVGSSLSEELALASTTHVAP